MDDTDVIVIQTVKNSKNLDHLAYSILLLLLLFLQLVFLHTKVFDFMPWL